MYARCMDLHVFGGGSINGSRYRVLEPIVRLFWNPAVPQFLNMDNKRGNFVFKPCRNLLDRLYQIEACKIHRGKGLVFTPVVSRSFENYAGEIDTYRLPRLVFIFSLERGNRNEMDIQLIDGAAEGNEIQMRRLHRIFSVINCLPDVGGLFIQTNKACRFISRENGIELCIWIIFVLWRDRIHHVERLMHVKSQSPHVDLIWKLGEWDVPAQMSALFLGRD
ncbi:hypothetical protein TNCV_1166511 [Trichonephila clavipes]|uniref:Uncharacterized protein n=1 Tax=Trichonephila clavipes TaxID=2585209 RepID=A0A8X6VSP5_TRICX|nr:hypothetical protein TNCV_1166511 [Trichonephila clavipes]